MATRYKLIVTYLYHTLNNIQFTRNTTITNFYTPYNTKASQPNHTNGIIVKLEPPDDKRETKDFLTSPSSYAKAIVITFYFQSNKSILFIVLL